jgi:hypothetical protein
MRLPAGLFAGKTKRLKKVLAIVIVTKDFLAPIVPVHQIVDRSLILDS